MESIIASIFNDLNSSHQIEVSQKWFWEEALVVSFNSCGFSIIKRFQQEAEVRELIILITY